MKHLTLAVNKVPFPPDSVSAVNQEQAYRRFLYTTPPWCDLIRLGMKHDYPEDGCLRRDAVDDLGGDLHLPFIREILDYAHAFPMYESYDFTPDESWIGLMNTDTLVTPLLFQRLQEMPTTTNAVLVAVADINHIEETVGRHRRRDWHSYDMVLFTRSLWDAIRYEVPDCVLGAQSWDGAYFWWLVLRHGVNLTILRNQECLHLAHKADWRANKNSPANLYNDQIFRELAL